MFFRKMRAKYTSIIRKLPSAHAPPTATPAPVETSLRITPAKLMTARISQPEIEMLLRMNDGGVLVSHSTDPPDEIDKSGNKTQKQSDTIAHGYVSK